MSNWVLHFVHDRASENEITIPDLTKDYDFPRVMPAHADSKIDERFQDFHYAELDRNDLESDASASQVLCRIVDQGVIKSVWSFRSGKATIYGPKSAVCFTEMPLSSLVEYAKKRSDTGRVGEYAIGLLKSELFAAGGRPVIYGLSGEHREILPNEKWPRFLESSCGIGEHEQYRYVALNLGSERFIDWTHEREWRWADHKNQIDVPGLPVWRKNLKVSFTKTFILVRTDDEAQNILSQLRRQWDAKEDNWGVPFDLELIEATRVVSLESLRNANLLLDGAPLTIEGIPSKLISTIPLVRASAEVKEAVSRVIHEAQVAASNAAVDWAARNPRDADAAGFAELLVEDGLTEFTRAGVELGLLHPFAGIHPFGSGGYWVDGLTRSCNTQSLGQREAATGAAMKVIQSHYPDLPLRIWTRWD